MVTNKSVKIIGFILGFFLILGCNSRSNKSSEVGEDFVAKQNLQGIWLDDDDDFESREILFISPILLVCLRISALRRIHL